MRNSSEIRLQRVVAYFCATLFSLFSFVFIACYQAPLLEMLYNHVATGKLEFNSMIVAAILTSVLTLLAVWLNRFARFQREWTAMAYLPSSLILAFITDIDRSVYIGGWHLGGWITIFIIGLLVYLFLSFVLHRMLFEKIKNLAMSTNRMLWRNLILLVLLFITVGTLSNGDGNIKREALAASLCNKGEYARALEVGIVSSDASRQLTALRAYAMTKDGSLGERLFSYPQYYGANGLLPARQQDSPLVPDSVYAMLGGTPGEEESVVSFLERISSTDSATNAAKDYYLSALLLDKRLQDFKETLYRMYEHADIAGLPRHYREALLLYSTIEPEYKNDFSSDSLYQAFDSLENIESRHDDIIIRGNCVRKDFGHTYWWYFLYGD